MTVAIEGNSPTTPPSTPSPSTASRLIAGRFRLIEPLGRGGMGRVYRAHDELLKRPVAVKLIYDDVICDRDVQRECAREARAAARLNHPGIVRILDSGFDDGHCYVVMSLAQGPTLTELLREEGALPVDRALDIAIQVADALSAAHQEGVIHCDVKPGNLLIDSSGWVRLVDFGIARVTSSTTGLDGQTLQGSAEYVAPEQVEGASVDGRTDLYALGTVLYEMLTGRTPFGGGTIASILARRLVVDPPRLRDINPAIPPKVEQVVLRALARDPVCRIQSAAELRDALIAVREALPAFPARRRAGRATIPRLRWTTRPRRLSSGAALGVSSLARWARRLGEATAALVPAAPTRPRLLTPRGRPTLASGFGLAVLVGLLLGVAAARCGVAGVAAESGLASPSVAEARSAPAVDPPISAPTPVVEAEPPESGTPAATDPPTVDDEPDPATAAAGGSSTGGAAAPEPATVRVPPAAPSPVAAAAAGPGPEADVPPANTTDDEQSDSPKPAARQPEPPKVELKQAPSAPRAARGNEGQGHKEKGGPGEKHGGPQKKH
jgi:serine/threonine-protein kinase